MTALTQARTTTLSVPGSRPPLNSLAGFGTLFPFMLRRNWGRLTTWVVAMGLLVAAIIPTMKASLPNDASIAAYQKAVSSPALVAISGTFHGEMNIGTATQNKIWMALALCLGFASIFLITRNTRTEEQHGRLELLRSGTLGQHTGLVSAVTMCVGMNVLAGAAIALAAMTELDPVGGLAMGMSAAH